jgi:diaminopropionate ammonia-lyase
MTSLPQLTWVPRTGARDWRSPAAGPNPVAFHRSLPGYRPTPLTEIPELAEALGVARVLVKDESERLGLPAFKILGASWAIERVLSPDNLSAGTSPAVSVLVAATDGNHGRAVARSGRGGSGRPGGRPRWCRVPGASRRYLLPPTGYRPSPALMTVSQPLRHSVSG